MGPLDGVKILDLSQVISGPMATVWLADQGADVIKVEDGRTGDIGRWLGMRRDDIGSWFLTVNRGKKSIALDLKGSDVDRALLWRLVEWADVFVGNFRPGAMERLGFGSDPVRARNPRIIYCSISGFGADGPYAKGRVYDGIIQAVAGYSMSQADPHTGEPQMIRTIVCDKASALIAAQAITAALYAREKSGVGQHVDIPMLDASIAFLWPDSMADQVFVGDVPPSYGPLEYKPWKAKDGWFVTNAVQDGEFKAVCRALGRSDLAEDPRFQTRELRMQNSAVMRAALAEAALQFDLDTLMRRMLEEDAPAGRVNRRDQLMHDPQVQHNGTIVEIDHGDVGRVRQPRHPVSFSGTPCNLPRPAPHLGEHDAEIRGAMRRKEAS